MTELFSTLSYANVPVKPHQIAKFSEDEARDWHGRWTADGETADQRRERLGLTGRTRERGRYDYEVTGPKPRSIILTHYGRSQAGLAGQDVIRVRRKDSLDEAMSIWEANNPDREIRGWRPWGDKTWVAKYDESEPRDYHGRWASGLGDLPAADRDLLVGFGVKVEPATTDTRYDPATRTIYLEPGLGREAILHESGHALDHALGWPSQTSAYRALAKPLGATSAGTAAEIYATAYAVAHGAGTPYSWDKPLVATVAPAVAGVLRIAREGRTSTQELGLDIRGPYAAIKCVAANLRKYSPEEPRDDHGRWTDGGTIDAEADKFSAAGGKMYHANSPERLAKVRERWESQKEKLTNRLLFSTAPEYVNRALRDQPHSGDRTVVAMRSGWVAGAIRYRLGLGQTDTVCDEVASLRIAPGTGSALVREMYRDAVTNGRGGVSLLADEPAVPFWKSVGAVPTGEHSYFPGTVAMAVSPEEVKAQLGR